MMDIVLIGLKWKTCLIYLDDVVVFSKSFDSHLSELKDVLTAIKKAGLRLKISKCQFGVTTLHMLGHLVDQQGIRPNPEKVRAVQDFPPKDVKSVRSFLGLCSYYRKCILNFASIAKPLTILTKSSTPFVWKEDQEASMLKLKNNLIEKTFLAHPDHLLPMEIHPDASSYGIGAVLIQRIEGLETNRLLKGSELNYTITEKECLAAIWVLKKFQYLVWGCQIIIVLELLNCWNY